MRLILQVPAALVLMLTSFACSDAPQGTGPGGAVAGSPAGGNAAGGVPNAGTSGSVAGGASGTAVGGAAGGGGGAAGSAGLGGLGGSGGMPLSDDPGTRAYQIHCYMCHGEQGASTPLAPETQHPVRDYSTWVVRNGLPGVGYLKPMEIIPPDMLSDADLMLIYDYLDKPPQPTTGQALYLDYCGNCHGADGKGGPTTRDITGTVTHPFEEVSREGTHPGMYEERNEYMPGYPPTRISDAELQLIIDYVETLP